MEVQTEPLQDFGADQKLPAWQQVKEATYHLESSSFVPMARQTTAHLI